MSIWLFAILLGATAIGCGRHAVRASRRPPRADRRWGRTTGCGNLPRFPPVLREFNRPLAARLLPGLGKSMSSVHVRLLAHGKHEAVKATVSNCAERGHSWGESRCIDKSYGEN